MDSMSEYQLSWTSFTNNLCNGLSQLQQKEQFVDMTLAADGHLVKVHRNILSIASPYIKEMLQSTTCRDPVVFLNNVSYQVLSYILEYIYTGEVKVPIYILNTFIKAAKSLHITGIKDLVAPMVPQEFSQSFKKKLSKRPGRHAKLTTADEKLNSMESYADSEITEENDENQPLATDENLLTATDKNTSKLKENMDAQAQFNSNNIDNYTNDLDGMDIDMSQPQIMNTQTLNEKSMLEKAMENIICVDANEADKVAQYKANITLNLEDDGSSRHQNDREDITINFETDGVARLQNDRESAAPNINFEIKSCQRGNESEYPVISISFDTNTQRPEGASDSLANPQTEDKTQDASAPLYSISERGSLQIILNRFIYNMHHSSHRNQKRRWRCAEYRKLNCKAYIDTSFDENIVERKNEHTHGFHDAKIIKKGSDQKIYSTIAEAEAASKADFFK